MFIDVPVTVSNSNEEPGGEKADGTSKVNQSEAVAINEFVQKIEDMNAARRARGSQGGLKFAILTPYASQKKLLETIVFPKSSSTDFKGVFTVDGFQGSEVDIVLFSTVRSKKLGFLADERRMNVALTRSKHAIVVFGCKELLSGQNESSPWKKWIEKYS